MFRGRAVVIYCTDKVRSSQFYADVLGARRLPTDNGATQWFQLGDLRLSLCSNAAKPTPGEFPTHAMPVMWLDVDDIVAARRHLQEHGVGIDEIDDSGFLITDPDGLLIEVWQSSDDGLPGD